MTISQESGLERVLLNVEGTKTRGIEGLTGDLGLFQIQLPTANEAIKKFAKKKDFVVQRILTKAQVRDDDAINTIVATFHFKGLLDAFDGNAEKALGAYKQGLTGYKRDGATRASKVYAKAVRHCESILKMKRSNK